MNTKKLALAAVLIAAGVLTGHVIFIPVGVSRCFPVQHAINVISAVFLGPGYALLNALSISLLRNIAGTGTILAFPGSMFGALLAAIAFRRTHKTIMACAGEVFGTGIIGGLAAFPVALLLMGKETGALFFVIPFLLSTLGGSFAGYLIVNALQARGRRPFGEKR